MQRREFLKTGAIFGATLMSIDTMLMADGLDVKPNLSRTFMVNLSHELKEGGKIARIWVPIPFDSDYQRVLGSVNIDGNFKKKMIYRGEIPLGYAEFQGVKNPVLNINFKITTTQRNTDFSRVNFNENEKLSPEVSNFLKPTAHIQTSGIVKQKADEIVGGISGDLERARAIYLWVANNMSRDESVVGCGIGDAEMILKSGKLYGKCTDINSVFVALARSVGIPAREVFGIRVGRSSMSSAIDKADENLLSSITSAQHCRAEFYLKGYGWIPVDPADVTKVRLAENLSNSDAKLAKIRDYLFGNWEMCWIGFNHARDFVLQPKPAEFPLNNFNYPYAEVDENVLNYYDAKEFGYSYKSQEIKI